MSSPSCKRRFLILTSFLLAACSHPDQGPVRTTVEAPVALVQRVALPSFHSVAGTVRSETTSTLAANVVGTIVRVHVAEGDRVRAGEVVVEIDARERHAQVAQAEAGREEVEHAIAFATANAKLAETTFQRYKALRERGSASQQELDEAEARHTAAQAELARLGARRNESRAAATQADAVLAYSSVRAPIDGVVTARFVDPGAQAAPGVPLLTIEDETATRIDANAPEGLTVHLGDRALIETGDQRLAAHVTHIQPSVDTAARSALVKLQLEQPLRAGTYVKVSFPLGERDVIAVPLTSLVRRGELTSVFVVGSDGVARMRLITVGSSDGAQAEILSGLEVGEAIVSAPGRVREGVVVRRGA
jgi:RND family efflux transporter MFP subunit